MRLRERIGSWIAGSPLERGAPIPVTPETGVLYGTENTRDPYKRQVLDKRLGVASLAQRAIANRIASISWVTKQTIREDAMTTRDEIVDGHPLTELLSNPHPDFTGRQLFRLLGEAMVTVGEGYWYLVDNSFNRPATLQPQQVGDTWPLIRNGEVYAYGHRDGNGLSREIRTRDIVRFWMPDLATLYTSRGYFVPNFLYSDTQRFQAETMRRHFERDATPKIILKAAEEIARDPSNENWDRFQKTWQNAYHARRGTKTGLPAQLPTGWDVVQIAAESGSDVAPLLEWLEQEELMNYGVPNAVLGKVISGDRSSAEAVSWIFDTYTIQPLVDMIKDTINHVLVPRFGGDGIFMDYEPFVAPDKAFDLERQTRFIEAKVLSPDEVREVNGHQAAEDWDGSRPPGKFGDTPYTGEDSGGGVNPFAPADPEPESDDTEDVDPGEDEDRQRSRLRQWFEPRSQWAFRRQAEVRFMRSMTGQVRRVFIMQEAATLDAFRKFNQRADEDVLGVDTWGILWEEFVEPVRRRAYMATGQTTMQVLTGRDFQLLPHVVNELRRQGADLVTNANSTTIKALREQLAEGAAEGEGSTQLARRIREVFKGRRDNAETIARTELLRAVEDAQVESFTQSGVVERKRWNSSLDDRVRDSHIESGIPVVAVNEAFTLTDGEQAQYPGDPNLSARNSINCRCFVTPVFEDEP